MSAYLQFGGNLSFRVISRAQQCSRFFQVRFCKRSWSATKPPPPPRGFKSSIDALPQYIALEFSERGEDMKRELAGRRRGVDVFLSEWNSTSRSLRKAAVSSNCRIDRARRSSFQTITTSPLRALSSRKE